MDRKKRLVSGLFDDNLRYRPVKDSILIFLSFLMVVIIVLVTFLVRPSLDNVHVEIRYGTTLLWDPEDETRNTAIPFPESGEYTITYTREDGEIFLGEGQQFDFYGEEVAITLYSDRSIQIIQPDLCNTGGITEGKKICDMAHTYDIGVQGHCCGSPISTAATLQLEAVIPNFVIHELHASALLPENIATCKYNYVPKNGYYEIPDLPGIGQELTDEALANSDIVTVR